MVTHGAKISSKYQLEDIVGRKKNIARAGQGDESPEK